MTTLATRPGAGATVPAAQPVAETTAQKAARYLFAGTRLALGWIFLWAFLDKLFGLGHSTPSTGAWINGGSPTKGFLAPPRPDPSRTSTTASPVPPGPTGSS